MHRKQKELDRRKHVKYQPVNAKNMPEDNHMSENMFDSLVDHMAEISEENIGSDMNDRIETAAVADMVDGYLTVKSADTTDTNCETVPADNIENVLEIAEVDDEGEETTLEYSIAFLGSSKVGKTSILQQFLHHSVDNAYVPSSTFQKHHKAIYMDGKIYDLTLRDCPGVSSFPKDSLAEYSTYKGYGLHLSKVFVLVYDTSNGDTFNYVKSIREQILMYKKDSLIIVVGNKLDITDPGNSVIKNHLPPEAKRWKCPFVLCSAKYNWHIIKVFTEILKTISSKADQSKKEAAHGHSNRWVNTHRCKIC